MANLPNLDWSDLLTALDDIDPSTTEVNHPRVEQALHRILQTPFSRWLPPPHGNLPKKAMAPLRRLYEELTKELEAPHVGAHELPAIRTCLVEVLKALDPEHPFQDRDVTPELDVNNANNWSPSMAPDEADAKKASPNGDEPLEQRTADGEADADGDCPLDEDVQSEEV